MLENYPREKRLDARVNQLISVDIYYNGQFIATKQSKNLSIGGMLIETEDLGLSIYSLIELEIEIPKPEPIVVRIPAIVKRISDSSIAVTFESIEPINNPLLKELLLIHQPLWIDNGGTPEAESI